MPMAEERTLSVKDGEWPIHLHNSKRRQARPQVAHGNAVGKRIKIPERRRRDTAKP